MRKCLEKASCSRQKVCCGCCCDLQSGMIALFVLQICLFLFGGNTWSQDEYKWEPHMIVMLMMGIFTQLPRVVAFICMYCKEGTESSRWMLVAVQAITLPIATLGLILMIIVLRTTVTNDGMWSVFVWNTTWYLGEDATFEERVPYYLGG